MIVLAVFAHMSACFIGVFRGEMAAAAFLMATATFALVASEVFCKTPTGD